VADASGRRSHVRREIDEEDAAVVRQVFRLCAEGHGTKAIAKRLNQEGFRSPRAPQGCSQSWSPTSVRAVLFRPLYRGEIVWNKTRNCDRWGETRRSDCAQEEWIRVPAPHLRIVSDQEWEAAHAHIAAARCDLSSWHPGTYLWQTAGGCSVEILTDESGAVWHLRQSIAVSTRSHGSERARLYGCSGYLDRGRTVCMNRADVPMAEADSILLEARRSRIGDGRENYAGLVLLPACSLANFCPPVWRP
jgi:Recombinase